ncbi:MAG: GAF domain-containing protein, partial [Ardenticatenaceae bacterium]
TDACSIFLFDQAQDRLNLRATNGPERAAIGNLNVALGQGITGRAAEEGQPIVVADVSQALELRADPLPGEEQYGSMVAVPIILFSPDVGRERGDQLQGVISIQHTAPRPFDEEEVHFMEVVAGELAFFVASTQRYEQTDEKLRQKLRELTILQQVTAAIAATLDLPRVLQLIVEQAVKLSHVDRADIYQSDESGEQVALLASFGGESDARLGHVILRALARANIAGAISANDATRVPELADVAEREGYQSLLCIPLRIGSRIIGVVALYSRERRDFDYEATQLLYTFADTAAIAIENARLYEEAQRALHVKEALLHELDHRVGNNFLTMKALLEMHRRRLEPGSPAAAALAQ